MEEGEVFDVESDCGQYGDLYSIEWRCIVFKDSNQQLQFVLWTRTFPAALISCWLPVHVAIFHNSKVIITGLKSEMQADTILDYLIEYVHNQRIVK